MQINKTRTDDVLTVVLEGRLDSTTAGEFDESMTDEITESTKMLILDLAGVDYISSKGIRVIVSLYKKMGARPIELHNANTAVQEVFKLSGLTRYFTFK